MNSKIIIIPIIIVAVIGIFVVISPSEESNTLSAETPIEVMLSEKIIQTNVNSLFKVFSYEDDFEMIDGEKIWRNAYYELDESKSAIYDELKNRKNSVVVFPIFTAAAYSEPGFYTFYRGECDQEFHGVLFRDDDCLTVKVDEEYNPGFTSSANGFQVLSLLEYDIITDITIHQNPDILLQYEKVILLHNEYVTQEEFLAITSHPNVIYLYPNALYAEIDFDEELWEISLIRGHNYPDPLIRNGFDWKYDNSLQEYDVECNDMKFSEISNGWMLNCYPENVLHKSKELLAQIRDF